MKAQPLKSNSNGYENCDPETATHIMINVKGPYPTRIIPVIIKGTRKGTGCWTWNGSTEEPTLKPSLLTKGIYPITDDEADRVLDGDKIVTKDCICHSFITDGKITYLSDCTHEFSGKTLNLLNIEEG